MSERILITGAAGAIGTMLRPRMARPERILRLLDIVPLPQVQPGECVETVEADITDLVAIRNATEDVDAIIHLGGIAHESDWNQILHTNIHGTYTVLEAARCAGVPRVILASSNHAVGFHPYSDELVPDYLFPRPDTYYGVSKAANEALGSLYHDRHGIDVLCVRIGSCFETPQDHRMLSTWLSPGDCAGLMEALLGTPKPGFRVLWGISANTRSRFSLNEARALGYQPQDDAEQYADTLSSPSVSEAERYIGGSFCV
ncbi:MAG: NAD(P)-dependent oxidoreductase [Pseudonocardiales bacterium]|nr:NAD(P)-dependent oxidoreductase [Pseudonocardiales bacterium]MBV9730898.1 NAD(P)-dependent oxidoreductase [Pseudonocardiales bacterium]